NRSRRALLLSRTRAPAAAARGTAPLAGAALRLHDCHARPKAVRGVNVLGFSAWFHDSAACLLRDGQLVAFAEEERFSRRKHTPEFPRQSIAYCLDAGGLRLDDVDAAVLYLD